MSAIRKVNIFSIIIILVTILTSNTVFADTQNSVPPQIIGSYAVTIDANTGEVLYDKDSNHKAYPASVTKVLTALLLMEKVKEDEKIILSQKCVNMEKSNSQINLQPGETMSRDTALFTMLTLSANDIACAIGEHISGSTEAFGKLMTKRAHQLGAVDSNFVTPNGLHDPNHYTTAYDMALIGREAIKNPLILKAMGTKTYDVNTSLEHKTVTNPGKIMDDPDAIGGKTGYTDVARNTQMRIEEKDGIRVVSVEFGANNQINKNNIYDDIKKISEYGIEQSKKSVVVDEKKWSKKLTFLGKQVLVKPIKTLNLTTKKSENASYNLEFVPKKINDSLLRIQGIQKGEVLGEIEIIQNNQKVTTVDVVSTESVTFQHSSEGFSVPFWVKLLVAVIIPIAFYIGYVFIYNYRFFNYKKKPV